MLTGVRQLIRISPSVVSFDHKIPGRIGSGSHLAHPSASHKPYWSLNHTSLTGASHKPYTCWTWCEKCESGCQLAPQREHNAAG